MAALASTRNAAERLALDALASLACEKWLAERQERGVRSIADDRGRFANHVPRILGRCYSTR